MCFSHRLPPSGERKHRRGTTLPQSSIPQFSVRFSCVRSAHTVVPILVTSQQSLSFNRPSPNPRKPRMDNSHIKGGRLAHHLRFEFAEARDTKRLYLTWVAHMRTFLSIEFRFGLRPCDCYEAFTANRIHRAVWVVPMREARLVGHCRSVPFKFCNGGWTLIGPFYGHCKRGKVTATCLRSVSYPVNRYTAESRVT